MFSDPTTSKPLLSFHVAFLDDLQPFGARGTCSTVVISSLCPVLLRKRQRLSPFKEATQSQPYLSLACGVRLPSHSNIRLGWQCLAVPVQGEIYIFAPPEKAKMQLSVSPSPVSEDLWAEVQTVHWNTCENNKTRAFVAAAAAQHLPLAVDLKRQKSPTQNRRSQHCF